jgi:hypothetical protein
MLGEIPYMIVWGFFSAMGWMGASYTVEKLAPEKPKQETQICSDWQEEASDNGKILRTRQCEAKSKDSP